MNRPLQCVCMLQLNAQLLAARLQILHHLPQIAKWICYQGHIKSQLSIR